MTKSKSKKTCKGITIMAVLFFLATSLIGCGGGGGGGAEAPAVTESVVELKAEAKKVADTTWSTTGNAKPGETITIRVKVSNKTDAGIKPTVIVTLPSSLEYVGGSGKFYKTESGTKEEMADDIKSDDGATLTQEISSDAFAYIEFQAKAIENAINGNKTVTVKIDGKPTTVLVKITDGDSCPTITNPTCGMGTHLVAGANDADGCATVGTCVQDSCPTITNPICGTGTHLVAGANDSNGCPTTGSCVADTCATVTQPNCASGYHREANPNVNGCPVADSCIPDAHTCSPVTNPTCPNGQHLVAGGTDSYGCQLPGTCVADPVTQTGVVTVRTNVANGVANVYVSCNGSANQGNFMWDMGGGYWGYTKTMYVGTCTLSNYPTTMGSYTLNTSASTLTGTLTTSGLFLTLMYDGAPAPVEPDPDTGGLIGPGGF